MLRRRLFTDGTSRTGLTCRFSKVWQGYPRNLWPWKLQNNEISINSHGSEAGIVKFQWNLKVLEVLAGRSRESRQGGTSARPGSNIVENVRSGCIGALPRTLATYALSRPLLPDPPGLVLEP